MKKEKMKKKNVINISVVLSFMVAFVAVLSLSVYGIVGRQGTAVSYAAPTPTGADYKVEFAKLGGEEVALYFGSQPVPIYVTDGSTDPTNPTFVFCVEYKYNPHIDATYSTGEEITDNGLLYILNNAYGNENFATEITGTSAQYVRAGIIQAAIWIYLHEKIGGDIHTINDTRLQGIKNASTFQLVKGSDLTSGILYDSVNDGIGNAYTTYISGLVERAKAANALTTLSVSQAEGDPSKIENFYQSTLITVVGSSNLINYDISLNGIEGAFVVDEEGNEMSLTGVSPDKKFYVRIPADKVTETSQDLTISVEGYFSTLTGTYYGTPGTDASGDPYQMTISVTGTTDDLLAGTVITFVGAPDTGMNKAQTIYFIGLVILLCGVGIVYANAKPVESKQ